MINTIKSKRIRQIVEKHYNKEEDAVRIAEIVEKILADFIDEGLNKLLIEHINPKLKKLGNMETTLENILSELEKMNKRGDREDGAKDGN